MRIIFKKLTILLLTLSSLMAYGFDVTGERINLSGKISSTSLTSTGGVIDVVSDNEKYGKTWLTYNVKLDNPNSSDQGSFQGRALAINNDGSRASASRQGIWSRDGHVYSFYSLDDVSDGNQYLCITTMNLKDDTVEMRFYPR